MITVPFTNPTTVTIRPAVVATTSSFNILQWRDTQTAVLADVSLGDDNSPLNSTTKTIVLWDSTTTPSYSDIGDWTQAQAIARATVVITE